MNIKFIKSNEKKKILAQLKENFGITNLPYLFIETGKEKIRAYSGHLSKEELLDLKNSLNIEVIGLYFLRKENDIRLSTDAPHLLKDQIIKGIIEIDETQVMDWIRGLDLNIKKPSRTYLLKFENIFIGSGKSNGEKIINHLPKSRRLKK